MRMTRSGTHRSKNAPALTGRQRLGNIPVREVMGLRHYPLSRISRKEMTSNPFPTVLRVEVQDTALRALCNCLEKNWDNILEAKDGKETLLIAERHPAIIHALATDFALASKNGRELDQQGLPPLVPIPRNPFCSKRFLHTIKEIRGNRRPLVSEYDGLFRG
jgi:hypothetical protein